MEPQPPRKWPLTVWAVLLAANIILVFLGVHALYMVGRPGALVIAALWAIVSTVRVVQERRVYIEARREYLAHHSAFQEPTP